MPIMTPAISIVVAVRKRQMFGTKAWMLPCDYSHYHCGGSRKAEQGKRLGRTAKLIKRERGGILIRNSSGESGLAQIYKLQ